MAIWNDMLSKVAPRLVLQCHKRFLQCRPAENIDAHRSQIALWLRRLLLEFGNPSVFICNYDAESAGFFDRHRHCCNCYICIVLFMIVEHDFIIHLIDMVSGKN